MNVNNKTARVAGFLYLLVIICGAFAEVFVRSSIIVPGDAAATANNIMDSEWLFRIGFVSDLIMVMSYFLLGFTLYMLLKPVNKNLALLMLLLNLIGVPLMGINMLNQFAALLVLNGADYLNVFEADQLQALSLLFLNLHKYGYFIATISFGSWLLPLGYLVFKSGYFPRILGVLFIIASFCYLIDFLTRFLLPNSVAIISPIVIAPVAIVEVSFCLWLLVKGVKVPE